MSDEGLVFNGVDGDTGKYVTEPLDAAAAERLARCMGGATAGPGVQFDDLSDFYLEESADEDWSDLAFAGWGVLFGRSVPPAARQALAPLLELRKDQAKSRYRVFEGRHADVAAKGDVNAFLELCDTTPGMPEPEKLPYYLLLVGDPTDIPYAFQHGLDLMRACGRIHFEGTCGYARYAEAVVAAETPSRREKALAVFAPANLGDRATSLSRNDLVNPLIAKFGASLPNWSVIERLDDAATLDELKALVRGPARPRIVFTASHGLWVRPEGDDQEGRLGSLVCQDWLPNGGQDSAEYAFGRAAVPKDASLAGAVWFAFACFGAGTPADNEFHTLPGLRLPKVLAPRPFVSALPRHLLSHEAGAALAFIGHVERAWSCSFQWRKNLQDHRAFSYATCAIAKGKRVGDAMGAFGLRNADVGRELLELQRPPKDVKDADAAQLGSLWTQWTDTRNFVVVGDPAVRFID